MSRVWGDLQGVRRPNKQDLQRDQNALPPDTATSDAIVAQKGRIKVKR